MAMNDKVIKEELRTMSTVDLIMKLSELERQIQMAILMFDEYHCELRKRFPNTNLEDTELKIKRKNK